MPSNLVISPVGDGPSHHRQWLRGARSFELMLVNYSGRPGLHAADPDHYAEASGFKLEVLGQALSERLEWVRGYDAVWLPDPDLSIRTQEIERLFSIFHEFGLDLAQPAISNRAYNHAITRRQRGCHLRYVNFVEMMCPLFRTELLLEALDSFGMNRSGWGVDWYWAQRFQGRRLAVIDAVSVVHTRPARRRGPYYRKLRGLGISAGRELEELVRRHALPTQFREYGRVPAREPRGRLRRMLAGALDRVTR